MADNPVANAATIVVGYAIEHLEKCSVADLDALYLLAGDLAEAVEIEWARRDD